MVTAPRQGDPVDRPCMRCKREPRTGETFGPHAEGWDFIGLCPECWDVVTEPDED
jgi:hypothetical protein